MVDYVIDYVNDAVALRKESVDRNCYLDNIEITEAVALRKESVDRNLLYRVVAGCLIMVALRKESVDRNSTALASFRACTTSLSARRAWIEISTRSQPGRPRAVALRKESVDRNT